jgi:hypothetical protein
MPGHRVLLSSTDSKTRRNQAAAPEHKSQGMDRVEQSEAVQITVFGGPLSHVKDFCGHDLSFRPLFASSERCIYGFSIT